MLRLNGRPIARMICEHFKIRDADVTVLDLHDILSDAEAARRGAL